MKKIFFAFLSLLPIFSYSAIEIGNYTGIDEDAVPCSIQIKERRFLSEHPKNPLNERFKVVLGDREYTAHRPVLVNHQTRDVSYDSSYLYAHHGTANGAFLLSIYISDEVGGEGPLSFEVVEQNWRTGAREVSRCLGLVYRQ